MGAIASTSAAARAFNGLDELAMRAPGEKGSGTAP
jgi:hypothetical protein